MGIFVWFFFFIFACSDDNSSTNSIPEGEIELQSGVPQKISSDIIIEMIKVNDSRCPVGVVCSSAGKVDITFKVLNAEKSFEKSLPFYPSKKQSCDTIDNVIIYINEVLPYKYANDILKLEDYRIIMEIEAL